MPLSAFRVDGVRAWKPADDSSDSWLADSIVAQPASVKSPQTAASSAIMDFSNCRFEQEWDFIESNITMDFVDV